MNNYKRFSQIILIGLACIQFSCKKFLEIPHPKSSLVTASVFENDAVATSAVTGIYNSLAGSGFASGGMESITVLCGVSADEFISHNTAFTDFYQSRLNPATGYINGSLYQVPYQQIYTANLMIEGLNDALNLSPSVKAQLKGEVLFVRAFVYFYLLNLYGSIPLHLSSDYRVNEVSVRSPEDKVYNQIIADLMESIDLLAEDYPSVERIRPNKSVAQAFLARVYLYRKDWGNAEKYASFVINKSSKYKLVDPNIVFLKNSEETIWQLMPAANTNTKEGALFILPGVPTNVSLDPGFARLGFETGDKRKTAWVRNFSNNTGTYYYPYKYRVRSSTNVTEYSMVLRLAEQYLIRSEARAQQNNLNGAIEDIDYIRNRAEIPLIKNIRPDIDKIEMLSVIQKERRVEFFSEWGHRWFDLKRTETINAVLSLVKTDWKTTAQYYPIPQNEINKNKNITQNPGY